MLDPTVWTYVMDGEAIGGVHFYRHDDYQTIAASTIRAWHTLSGLAKRIEGLEYRNHEMIRLHTALRN